MKTRRVEKKEMKKKKKQIWIPILLVILLILVISVIIIYRNMNQFELNVAGEDVSKEEYLNCMELVEYDTKIQIQEQYNCEYGEDFWEKKYGGKYGYEILRENTIKCLQQIHAVYEVAKENGDVQDVSFAGLEKRWKKENADRSEKVENGEVVYGVKEYTFDLYLQYEMSRLKEIYCNDKDRDGMLLTEEEIVEYYNSREWIYGEDGEKADLETARISVERELREKKYDEIVKRKAENSKVDGEMKQIDRFTLKNI
ncbi:MAG: hypothetical protein Q4C84_07690 [Bacillota bacterium]|nr:hypothetical protein [Bacillota bacterium]